MSAESGTFQRERLESNVDYPLLDVLAMSSPIGQVALFFVFLFWSGKRRISWREGAKGTYCEFKAICHLHC